MNDDLRKEISDAITHEIDMDMLDIIVNGGKLPDNKPPVITPMIGQIVPDGLQL